MSIFDNLLRRKPSEMDNLRAEIAAIKAKAESWPSWALETAHARQFEVPEPIVYDAQAHYYQRLSYVYQAVHILCSVSATTPFEIKRKRGEKTTGVEDHAFEQLLRAPNPMQGQFEFLMSSFAFYKLNGNCYWWLNKSNEDAQPAEMWLLPPSSIKVVPDGQMYIKGYLYDPGDGSEVPLDPWEVVYFRDFHPLNWWVGMGAMEPAALTAQNAIGMQEWSKRLFSDSNGKLPGILAFASPIPDTEWEKMKADVRDKANKRDLMMLRSTGKDGVNWMKAAETQREMEFIAGLQTSREDIYNTIAPGLLAALSPSANVSNSEAGYVVFRDWSVFPLHVAFGQKITQAILPAYSSAQISLVGEFEDVRTKDQALELQKIATYSLSHTVKEVREKFYDDKPVGDERDYLFPAQVTAQSTQPEQEPEVTQPEELPTVMQPIEPQEDQSPDMPEIDTEDDEELPPAMMADLDRWKRKAKNALDKGRSPAVKFDSDAIPADIFARIETGLKACKTSTDVSALFADIKSVDAEPPVSDADNVLEAIRLSVEALKAVGDGK